MHYGQDIDAAETCNSLRVGRNNRQGLVKMIDFRVEAIALTDITNRLAPRDAPNPRVALVAVIEPLSIG